MSTYAQRQWLKKHNETLIPGPNCRVPFCMAGNEYGKPQDSKKAYSPMARCPNCAIIPTEGLAYDSSRWWEPLRDLERMTDEAEGQYESEHEANP